MTLFVFGAGATRGCSFVDSIKNPCLPFLDSDFFTQLQRVRSIKHQTLIVDVMKDVVELFGQNFSVTMETVFSTLEQMITMLGVRNKKQRDISVEKLKKMQERLKQAIAVVLEESLAATQRGRSHLVPSECDFHTKFVSEILQERDSIISFNYDCVLDYALKNHGSNKWNPKFGYGFKLNPKSSNLKGYEKWATQGKGQINKNNTVHLYKLHGPGGHLKSGQSWPLQNRPVARLVFS